MAHFAELDNENKVLQVIVVANYECLDQDGKENEILGTTFCHRLLGGRWIQTSYNATTRGRFASIGDLYDETNDVFVSPVYPVSE
jgi:hypothetical protein